MTRILLIDDVTKAKIKRAIERAQRRPIPLALLRALHSEAITTGINDQHRPVMLADRRPGPPRPLSQQVLIPFGFRAAFSVEEQPEGFCRHLSVSVDEGADKRMPHPAAVKMIAEAFGIKQWDASWVEEFEPNRFAVNIIEMYLKITSRPQA